MPLHLRLLLPILCLGTGLALGYIQPIGLMAGALLITLLLFAEQRLPTGPWTLLSVLA